VNRKLIAFAAAAVAFVSYLAFFRAPADSTAAAGSAIQLAGDEHALGSPSAPIRMIEYGSPTCPVCARWDTDVFPQFKKTYVDTGKVHYVFRVFARVPLDAAVEAMGRCLPKDRYFPFIDMMYQTQYAWDPDGYQIPDIHDALIDRGRQAGLSAEEIESCISNQAELKKITAVSEYAAQTYGINSTPSFLIDGKFHQQDVMTWEGAQDVLNRLLAAKRK
jgi:protein-disulfide isomerase